MLVGLNGQLGSGKDSVYERAKLKYPEVVRLSFADKLKDSAAALLGVTVDDLNRWKNDSQVGIFILDVEDDEPFASMDFRTFLQRYGTESHRDVFGQDFWVTQGLAEYDSNKLNSSSEAMSKMFFVTDCRFLNEVEAIKSRGGQIWRVHGPDDKKNVDHISEQILPDELVDVEIDNTRRDDNFKGLDAIIEYLLEHPFEGKTLSGYKFDWNEALEEFRR